MVTITTSEFKRNFDKYLSLAINENIFITKSGKTIAKLSNPNEDRVNIAKSLFGILSSDMTLDESKEERLSRL